jgi:SAM-dependent methyltransferase
MTYLLLPGRQIVNTRYQEEYLNRILGRDLAALPEMLGQAPGGKVTGLVFAVTSCNRSNSRYNPLPFEIRAILVYEFARRLKADFGVDFHILGVPHYPPSEKFAGLVLKEITEQTEGRLTLTPDNTVVFSSTPPLIADYQRLGFAVLPGEYDPDAKIYGQSTPHVIVRQIGEETAALEDIPLSNSARAVFRDFPDALAQIRRLFHDPILTEQGDLTETRNYGTYTRDMAGAIDLKYREIQPFLRPGKIVDEGCADGALLQRVARDFPDSDLIGVDLSAEMLARARESQRAGAFGGAFVFFKQQNLMTPVSDAQADRADTILCNSTLHELWSYGEGNETVRAYLRGKRKQLRLGGCLVIRDVVGPDDKEALVLLECAPDDGLAEDDGAADVATLSARARFARFRRDFRPGEAHPNVESVMQNDRLLLRLPLGYAMEFIAKMDYADNWLSEMHEAFCFWSFADWTRELADAGLVVLPGSHAYVNEWRVEHSFQQRVRLYAPDGTPLLFPVTNMVLAAEK